MKSVIGMKRLIEENTTYAEEMISYSGTEYISDAIMYLADANTSIYYSDIIDFIGKNPEALTDTINELGWKGCGSDIYKAGQMAEYLSIEREIYGELDAIISYLMLDYLQNIGIYDITEELADEIEIVNAYDFDEFEDIAEKVNELFEEVTGESLVDYLERIA